VGTDLCQQAMTLMRCVHPAVFDRARQVEHVRALVGRVDDDKLTLHWPWRLAPLPCLRGHLGVARPGGSTMTKVRYPRMLAQVASARAGVWGQPPEEINFQGQKP